MKIPISICGTISVCFAMYACSRDPELQNEWYDADAYFAGGETTVFDASSHAFSSPASNITGVVFDEHMEGDVLFERTFVTAPSAIHGGLGPVFNNTSCANCHAGDGRGDGPSVFRISVPGISAIGGPVSVPGYGTQLQDKAIVNTQAEASVLITYIEEHFQYPDGTDYHLQHPVVNIQNNYTDWPADAMISLRVAPPVFGTGLLEAIRAADILEQQDVNDANADGISGKANMVWDAVLLQPALGRFGWKAGQPTLEQQNAAAFNEDMGVTNPVFKFESCLGQEQYDDLHDDTEISAQDLHLTTVYTKTLAVPAARNINDPEVLKGKELFFRAQCSTCHTPSYVTGQSDIAALSNQKIYPYTDLLLHDMGPGLADNRLDFLASGTEWKTRPLWGIGLTEVVNGHSNFLHDGRARSIEEAILWHGGEAERSKMFFTQLSAAERKALITFVQSL